MHHSKPPYTIEVVVRDSDNHIVSGHSYSVSTPWDDLGGMLDAIREQVDDVRATGIGTLYSHE